MTAITTTYPSLETILNLARIYMNDWLNDGAGQITTDTSPQTLPTLNASVRELYRQLRNVGSPTLIRDNVQIALPANGATGPGVQTYLSQQGYFDGLTLQANPKLPSDLLFPYELWEQQTGSGLPFVLMQQPQAGLPSVIEQGGALVYWEWRGGASFTAGAGGGDALFFVGSIAPVTIRIRYQAAMTQFSGTIDFANTYVPVMDCEDALAYKVAYKISSAISGMTPPVQDLKANMESSLSDLKLEIIRRAQTIEYHRQAYATGSQQDWGNGANWQ